MMAAGMHSGVGILILCLVTMIVTWFAFGQREHVGFWSKFRYWLKSTLVTASALVVWLCWREPGVPVLFNALFSIAFGGLMNLCRSQAGLMF
ncbi:hypothetical protein ABE485_24370 [Achromobacter spanius]|uniref:hypothetical protein n=1 Tax=Achromobacter spanius TaxID=217203 RepID=UPI0032081693